jgi:hypothetical protein
VQYLRRKATVIQEGILKTAAFQAGKLNPILFSKTFRDQQMSDHRSYSNSFFSGYCALGSS